MFLEIQPPDGSVTSYIIGAVVGLITAYITVVLSKKAEGKTQVDIARINADSSDHEQTKSELRDALDKLKEYQAVVEQERNLRLVIEKKFDAVKVAFGIIFGQYARQFQDDPEQLALLKELEEIINS